MAFDSKPDASPRLLQAVGAVSIALAVGSLVAAKTLGAWLLPVQTALAASLLLTAGALDAWRQDRWRPPSRTAPEPVSVEVPVGARRAWLERSRRRLLRTVPADLAYGALLLVLPLCAFVVLLLSRDAPRGLIPAARAADLAGAGVAATLAFALLVLERHCHAAGHSREPLRQLARMALLTALLIALGGLLMREQNPWAPRIVAVAMLLPAAVALELALRIGLSLFLRRDAQERPAPLARSLVAGLLRWPPGGDGLGDSLHSWFGIDLRQSWAFAYVRRSALPMAAAVLGIAWLLSGVRQIAPDQRGVHERFGRPVEVWGPGLHAGLPWPFSRLHRVDNGTVRTLSIGTSDEAPPPTDSSVADGPAPASANRLWDVSHLSEKSQVIARASTGERQSFEVVYMDVRFVWRVGLDDAAALAAAYRVSDLPTLIRSAAGRVLVDDFAVRTLEGVIGERREALARDIGRRVQQELDALGSGVEVLATLIEAVHPPAGAANAYHSVQAALIRVDAAIAREHGRSAEEANEAQLQAAMARDKAQAGAREALAAAEAVSLRFSAERDAYAKAGRAFVLEQYLGRLSDGLRDAPLLLLDHRIGDAGAGPTLDLRALSAAAALPPTP